MSLWKFVFAILLYKFEFLLTPFMSSWKQSVSPWSSTKGNGGAYLGTFIGTGWGGGGGSHCVTPRVLTWSTENVRCCKWSM